MYPVEPWERTSDDERLIIRSPLDCELGLSLNAAIDLRAIYTTKKHDFLVVEDLYGRLGFSVICYK